MEVLAVLKPGEVYSYHEGPLTYGVMCFGPDGTTIYKAFKNVPNGSYTPEELGLESYIPNCRKVNIGVCPHNTVTDYIRVPRNGILGRLGLKTTKSFQSSAVLTFNHPNELGHIGNPEYDDKEMCIRNGKYVFLDNNTPTEVIMHEYAHILAGPTHYHDEVWAAIIESLGYEARLSFSGYIV